MTTALNPIPVLDLRPQLESIRDEIMTAVAAVIDSTAYINGPATREFEDAAAKYLQVKHAIGLNSGTDALIIGLRALGIAAGDEVITTPFSFFATAESISIIGAKPVFVDVEEHSMNIDPTLIEAAITERTRAIVPVHLFGRPANMQAVLDIAQRHDLLVLEDCAQSFGARIGDQLTGSFGSGGAFSFFPSKNLGAMGDGGLFVTNDDDVAEMALKLRNHGAIDKYRNEMLGYNSRLDSIQAAILSVKLKYIDEWNLGRRAVASHYGKLLAETPGVITPEISPGHVFHQYTIRLTDTNRDQVHDALHESGIGCMVYYPVPQNRLPVYGDTYPELAVNELLAEQVLSLPIWSEMREQEIERVVATLRKNNHFDSN